MIINFSLDDPLAVGANVTEIVHFPPGGSGATQPFVTLNGSPTPSTPPMSTVIPGFFLLPSGLLTVIFFGPLRPPIFTVPKFNDVGLIFSLTATGVGVDVGVAVAVAVWVAVGVAVAVAV